MKKTLSTKEVADRLNVHLNTVYRYISKGILPAHKLGGNGHSRRHWKVRSEDLEAFTQEAEPEHGEPNNKMERPEQLADSASNLKM